MEEVARHWQPQRAPHASVAEADLGLPARTQPTSVCRSQTSAFHPLWTFTATAKLPSNVLGSIGEMQMPLLSSREGSQHETRVTLALLWVWALFNYVYGDVLQIFAIFMQPNLQAQLESGNFGGIPLTDTATLAMAAVMELSLAMVFLSWKLPYRTNRMANITIGSLFTVIMGLILFGPGRVPPMSGYTLYGLIEMGITVAIVVTAWKWRVLADTEERT
jgi:Family of unknown function (DUF6326)